MGIELEDETPEDDDGDPGQLVFEALRDTWKDLDPDTQTALVMSIGGGGPWVEAPASVKDACAELESALFDDDDDDQADGDDDDEAS